MVPELHAAIQTVFELLRATPAWGMAALHQCCTSVQSQESRCRYRDNDASIFMQHVVSGMLFGCNAGI